MNAAVTHAVIVMKCGKASTVIEQAIYQAHRLHHDQPFYVDLPGLSNESWEERRNHPIGRFAALYGSEQFCARTLEAVQGHLEGIKRQNELGIVAMLEVENLLSYVETGSRGSLAVVKRYALRFASDRAAQRKAQRLQERLERKGVVMTTPIVPVARCKLDEDGRWVGITYPIGEDGKGQRKEHRQLLTLPSSAGHKFTNSLSREIVEGQLRDAWSGAVDSYGFSRGACVPALSEKSLRRSMFPGTADLDAAAAQAAYA